MEEVLSSRLASLARGRELGVRSTSRSSSAATPATQTNAASETTTSFVREERFDADLPWIRAPQLGQVPALAGMLAPHFVQYMALS